VENFETRLRRKDGAIIWVSLSARLYPEEGYLEGYMIDITQRKVEQERLLAAEREQRLLAETLTEITLVLTAQTNHKAVLEEILRQAQRIVPCQKASIRLLTDNVLHIASSHAEQALNTQLTAKKDQSLADLPLDAAVIQSRQFLVIPDTRKEPRWMALPEMGWIRSHIATPICLGDHVLGLLRLDADTPHQFSNSDAARLQPLVNAAAIALENARLLEQSHQEIAERKRAEEALAAERNLLRTLIDNVPDFIYVKDTQSRFVLGSKSVAQAMGVPGPDDLVGQTDFDFIDYELAERFYADEQAVVSSGQPLIGQEELFISPTNNRKAWYSTATVPLRDNQGQIVGIVGLSHDVTKLKRAEQALLESQTRLKLLNSILTRLTAGLSLDQLIESTINQLADYFPTLRVAYSTIDDHGHSTVIHSIEPAGMPHLSGVTVDLGNESEYLFTLRQRKPVIVDDVSSDARTATLTSLIGAGGTRAFLDVPLHHSTNLVGVLCLDGPEPRQWSEHEITTLTEIAEYLSIARQNIH
jgi:PAS domain S-box-containing protein